jgi:hypothetical protein
MDHKGTVVLISFNGLIHAIYPNGDLETLGIPMTQSTYRKIEEIEDLGYITVMYILNKDGEIPCK